MNKTDVLDILRALDRINYNNVYDCSFNMNLIKTAEKLLKYRYGCRRKMLFRIFKDRSLRKKIAFKKEAVSKVSKRLPNKIVFICKKVNKYSRTLENTSVVSDDNLFIGITRIDDHWTVNLSVNGVNRPYGRFDSKLDAARMYDYINIKNGNMEGINFNYSAEEIAKIVNSQLPMIN
jgi:hypothetical protein